MSSKKALSRLCLITLCNAVLKRKMLTHFSPLPSVKRNNMARVGKAGAMVRSHSEAEAGSREREAPGVALLSPQGWAPGRRAALRTRPPFRGTGLGGGGRGEGEGTSAAPQRVGPSALCAQLCRCLPPGTARPHTKKPHPRACETAVPPPLPNRALPRPCSCPPAPSVPSRLPVSFPSLSLKQKSVGLPPTANPAPRPHLSAPRPRTISFSDQTMRYICPVLLPPPSSPPIFQTA